MPPTDNLIPPHARCCRFGTRTRQYLGVGGWDQVISIRGSKRWSPGAAWEPFIIFRLVYGKRPMIYSVARICTIIRSSILWLRVGALVCYRFSVGIFAIIAHLELNFLGTKRKKTFFIFQNKIFLLSSCTEGFIVLDQVWSADLRTSTDVNSFSERDALFPFNAIFFCFLKARGDGHSCSALFLWQE